MSATDLSAITLTDILPHRDGMLLIDDIIEVDEQSALVSSVMKKSTPLAEEDGVQPLIMVELAAQAAGVCNGLERIRTQGIDSNQMGWLVGVKRAQFFIDVLPFGSTVLVSSKNRHNYGDLLEVSCSVSIGETLVGEVTLQLYKAEEEDI